MFGCRVGTGLRLPSEYFTPCSNDTIHPGTFVARLKEYMQTLRASPPPSASHVFVRNDAVWKPLQQPYKGPYKVIDRTEPTYTSTS